MTNNQIANSLTVHVLRLASAAKRYRTRAELAKDALGIAADDDAGPGGVERAVRCLQDCCDALTDVDARYDRLVAFQRQSEDAGRRPDRTDRKHRSSADAAVRQLRREYRVLEAQHAAVIPALFARQRKHELDVLNRLAVEAQAATRQLNLNDVESVVGEMRVVQARIELLVVPRELAADPDAAGDARRASEIIDRITEIISAKRTATRPTSDQGMAPFPQRGWHINNNPVVCPRRR